MVIETTMIKAMMVRAIGGFTIVGTAAALIAAAPAMAQSRASLGERVTTLEAQLQQNQSQNQHSVELLNRIAQLESDIKVLRSQVEQLQNDNAQLKQHDRDQYIDLDGRLNRLEGGASAGANGKPTAAGKPVASSRQSIAATPPPAAPAARGISATSVADEQQSYDAGLAAVRSDQYADAARRFQAFVQQYPDSALAPNAYYWMGESYYVTQNYQLALDAFKTVLTLYPDSPKAPGSLLKLGYSQDGLKHRDAAVATLHEVIQRYPRSDAAEQAQSRLRAITMDVNQ